jgi:hypothetical protein
MLKYKITIRFINGDEYAFVDTFIDEDDVVCRIEAYYNYAEKHVRFYTHNGIVIFPKHNLLYITTEKSIK